LRGDTFVGRPRTTKKKRRTQAGIYSPALIDVTHEKLAATSADLAYISIGGSRRLALERFAERREKLNVPNFNVYFYADKSAKCAEGG